MADSAVRPVREVPPVPYCVHVCAEVLIPPTPRVLFFDDGEQAIPLAAVSDNTLREIGRLWTEALLAVAAEQRAAPLPRRIGDLIRDDEATANMGLDG